MTEAIPKEPRIRVAPIIVQDGALLLVRHVKGERTYWLLPGGGVEYGEPLEKACIREAKEETGLDIAIDRLVAINDSIPPDRHRHVVNIYFTAHITGGELALGADWNLAELRWVALEELAALEFYPDIREELLDAAAQAFPRYAAYLGNLWK